MLYMIVMYNFIPGMMANLALIANLFFTLGVLASFQSALTMPGIAGIVLTLGTAVDANVLIYERIKEEMRAGKGIKDALREGYSNAFSAIFDSNFTSLITGIILLVTGTGPIRGFCYNMDYWYCLLVLHSCVLDTSDLREPFEERQVVEPEVLYFNQQEFIAEYTH